MAHQTHNIPWEALSSSFDAVKIGARGTPERHTILETQSGEAAQKKREHFVRVFMKTLEDFSNSERKKYPAEFETYDDEAVILPDDVAQKAQEYLNSPLVWSSSMNTTRFSKATNWKDGFSSVCDDRADVVMALLVLNEIEPLLRIAHLEAEPLKHLWNFGGPDPGFNNIARAALMSYIFLNVIYCRPQLWMPEGSEGGGRGPQSDYRVMEAFVKVLMGGTQSRGSDAWTVPHRQFFGREFSYGENGQKLRDEGVDPLAPGNAERLKDYLKLCWNHLIRVHVVTKEAGMDIDWPHLVKQEIHWLWGPSAFPDLYT